MFLQVTSAPVSTSDTVEININLITSSCYCHRKGKFAVLFSFTVHYFANDILKIKRLQEI